MSEVVILDDFKMTSYPNDTKVIKDEFINHFVKDKRQIINNLSEVISSINSVKEVINPEKTYIAKFPKDILDKINSGQYDIMKTKDGEILSTVIDTTKPKNKNIIHQIRLDEINPNIVENITSISNSLTNLAQQQQLANVSLMLSRIQTLAIDIRRKQVLTVIGLVNSGKKQLEHALLLPDSDPNKNQDIHDAKKSLYDGMSQLELFIKDELKNQIDIPKNKFLLTIKSLFDTNFYDSIKQQYTELQEGIAAYFEASNFLVLAYENMNSKETIPAVLESTKEMIEISHGRLTELSDLVLNGVNNNKTQWYKQPEVLLDEIVNYNRLELPDEVEYVAIEIQGSDLSKEVKDE